MRVGLLVGVFVFLLGVRFFEGWFLAWGFGMWIERVKFFSGFYAYRAGGCGSLVLVFFRVGFLHKNTSSVAGVCFVFFI